MSRVPSKNAKMHLAETIKTWYSEYKDNLLKGKI